MIKSDLLQPKFRYFISVLFVTGIVTRRLIIHSSKCEKINCKTLVGGALQFRGGYRDRTDHLNTASVAL